MLPNFAELRHISVPVCGRFSRYMETPGLTVQVFWPCDEENFWANAPGTRAMPARSPPETDIPSLDDSTSSSCLRRTDRVTELASPPGYSSSLGQGHSEASRETEANLIVKKSWDVALAPWKQVPMNLFIMYMAGNSISIFPIMMVGMLFLRPVKALLTIQSTFKMIEGGQAILQKIVYLFGNLACLALALYKCSSMGLLPTHASDWLDFVEPLQRIEHSGGGIMLS
ncbi:ER membrane protein complex subunit 4 isoform X1 [Haemaphysalis longicornis]